MFWDKWIPAKYLTKSSVCGIEVLTKEDGTVYFYTLLKKQNNSLEITEQGVCSDLKNLPAPVYKNKLPVVVCFNGKGIILKKIHYSENETIYSEEFLRQRLPGMSLADFNIQLFTQDNQTLFAAIQRKEQMEHILKDLAKANLQIVDVFIGPPTLLAITQLLSSHLHLQPNFAKAELMNGQIEQIVPTTQESETSIVEVESLKIPSTQLLSFSAGFAYHTNQNIYFAFDSELTAFKSKHAQQNKFRFALGFFIVVGFTICLVNFLFFSTYFSQTKKLDTELSLYQGKYDKINELLTGYEKKKNLIEESGLLENYYFSTYTDKIAATIPHEVILTDLLFNPIDEKTNEIDSLVSFQKNLVLIKGNCNKSLLINEWVNVLKTQNFIKDVNLDKFLFNNDGNQPNFEIRIITR